MLKVFEAFSGYGSQSLALERLGIEHEVVAISEIDKYAIKAYYALHDNNIPNLGDISKIDTTDIPDHDLFTYSFPCQDISVAGKTKGIIKGETRSGLLYECEKIIEAKRPKYLLMENVKNLVGKKFKSQFNEWLEYLESLGYTNYWKVLNAKHYGVPQNRERIFVVSVLGEHEEYEFPKPIPLDKCINDILEDEVDEKYYINKPFNLVDKGHQAELDMKGQDCIKRAYGVDKIAPTLTTMQGGYREPKILIPQTTKKGYIEMEVPGICDLSYPDSKTRRGRVQEKGKVCPTLTAASQDICYVERVPKIICEQRSDEGLRFFKDNVCGTIRTINSGGDKRVIEVEMNNEKTDRQFRIRKLTPRECFRLMGLKDDDIDKIQGTGISNTQQYKMAGNSIVVDVLEAIFKNLFMEG